MSQPCGFGAPDHASSNRRTVRASERGEGGASGHRSNPCLPDGRWVAYNSLESGRLEVYVAAFPSFPQKRQLSAGGGAQPQWRGDGKELYYLAPDRKLMAGDVRSGATLETGVPHALFQFNAIFNGEVNFFAPAPDGQKFYFAEPSPEDRP
ncbi:MAG: hypothetical protein ACRD3B_09560 [Candidatus Sulfotelmatobacter sp.]